VGYHKGEMLGACTDCRRLWGEHRAGAMDQDEVEIVSGRLAPTLGTCMVMGTASTMACLAEALGIALPGTGSIPATHADRIRAAEASGRQAVKLANGGPKPSEILTEAAFHNAMVVLQAIGGSTNGLVHLAAIARRRGLRVDLEEFDRIGRNVPVLIDLKPSGAHYMEHFHWAGGVPRLLRELRDNLALDAMTITGETIGAIAEMAEDIPGQAIIRSRSNPVKASGGLAVLRGNLAPDGAVIKHSAASSTLLQHVGRAVVFDSVEDLTSRIDDPELDVHADDVLVLRNAGPKGAPGMPEAGYLPIPRKIAQTGVKDMVRISDARMSGTAFGTIVLHIAPEAATGGPLGLVRTGDLIRLDVPERRIDLLVEEDELRRRAAEWQPPGHLTREHRGYHGLYLRSVLQADEGCDFDFC
jgi:dihydroxy-acid dehydratase